MSFSFRPWRFLTTGVAAEFGGREILRMMVDPLGEKLADDEDTLTPAGDVVTLRAEEKGGTGTEFETVEPVDALDKEDAGPVDEEGADPVGKEDAEPVGKERADSVDTEDAEPVGKERADSEDKEDAEPVDKERADSVDTEDAGPVDGVGTTPETEPSEEGRTDDPGGRTKLLELELAEAEGGLTLFGNDEDELGLDCNPPVDEERPEDGEFVGRSRRPGVEVVEPAYVSKSVPSMAICQNPIPLLFFLPFPANPLCRPSCLTLASTTYLLVQS